MQTSFRKMLITLGLISALSWRVCHTLPVPSTDDLSSQFHFIKNSTDFVRVFVMGQVTIDCTCSDTNAKVKLTRRLVRTEDLLVDEVKITEKNGVFTINDINFNDGGLYSCTAENQQGEQISRDAATVIPLPFKGLKMPRINTDSYQLQYGESAKFICTGGAYFKLQWVKWLTDSTSEPVPEHMVEKLPATMHPDTKVREKRIALKIENAKEPWGVPINYACVCSHGNLTTKAFLVLLIKKPTKPKIKNFMQKVAISKGADFQVRCETRGSPRPSITWLNEDGEVINDCIVARTCNKPGQNYEIRGEMGQKLRVLNASRKNHGIVTCKANNEFGEDSRNMEIHVIMNMDDFPMDEGLNTNNPAAHEDTEDTHDSQGDGDDSR